MLRSRCFLFALFFSLFLSSIVHAKDQLKFIYISPDPIGANQFLQLGEKGVKQAGKKYQATTQVFESNGPANRMENVRAAIRTGAKVIVLLGFQFNDIVEDLADRYSQTQFLIVDQCLSGDRPDNVHCAVFREHESSYLLGAVAASLSKKQHVGIVSALDIPFLHRYTDGFKMGAKAINPKIQVDVRWVGGTNPFADPVRAKEQALAIMAGGADHIFSATAGGDYGVFELAKQKKVYAYGVDVNQCAHGPQYIVENTIKRVDIAVVESIGKILAGQKKTFSSYGLKEGGMSLVSLSEKDLSKSQCGIANHPDVVKKIEHLKQEIISGKIQIPDFMFAK